MEKDCTSPGDCHMLCATWLRDDLATHGIADLQKKAVAECLQSFNSVRGPMERLEVM